MVRRALRFIGVASLLISPIAAQFGVAGKQRKKGTTFQEINERAQEQMAAGGLAGLKDMANLNMDDLSKAWAEAMKDPELLEAMESLGKDVGEAMDELAKMSPDQLAAQVQEALKMITNGDIVETVISQKDEVLKNLEETGMMSKEEIEKLRNNPELFEQQMRESFSQMKNIFSDTETLNAATKMMTGFSELLSNPEKAMKELASTMKEELSDDDKIEEARLQLLANPELAGNPALASVFQSDEMKDVLRDPVKWRESVKKGQGMLLGEAAAGGGARVGEL